MCDCVHLSVRVTGNVKFLLVFLFVVANIGGHSFHIFFFSVGEVWEGRVSMSILRIRYSTKMGSGEEKVIFNS